MIQISHMAMVRADAHVGVAADVSVEDVHAGNNFQKFLRKSGNTAVLFISKSCSSAVRMVQLRYKTNSYAIYSLYHSLFHDPYNSLEVFSGGIVFCKYADCSPN